MNYNYDRKSQFQKYTGQPQKQDDKEISAWRKFLKTVVPWLVDKWDLGNAYLEAKVEKEQSEVEKIKAETTLLKVQPQKEMQEIIEIAARNDSQENEGKDERSTDELLNDLLEKIRILHVKHGFDIRLSIEDKENEVTWGGFVASPEGSDDDEKV